ncbi:hypothetical protein EON63_24460 [archaeon]|nr:MAG: hypothetical protein EON63_24460 [archaeon]
MGAGGEREVLVDPPPDAAPRSQDTTMMTKHHTHIAEYGHLCMYIMCMDASTMHTHNVYLDTAYMHTC